MSSASSFRHGSVLSAGDSVSAKRIRVVLAIALVAFLVGAITGANHSSSGTSALSMSFVKAWIHGDYATMYSEIDAQAQRTISASDFAAAYRSANVTATARALEVAGRPHEASGGLMIVPVRVHSALFGTLKTSFALPINGTGASARITWSHSLDFPGLRAGEQLTRRTSLPTRASLLARDGSILASGPVSEGAGTTERASPLGQAASAVVGTVGPIPSSRLESLQSEGVQANATVGLTGLERALDGRLRGSPGGELLAGDRLLARVTSHAASAVRTTISPSLQRTAVLALGGQLGGVVALEPASGQVLAVAGLGIDDLQPPGSTFKMVTLTGALENHIANPHSVFAYANYATLDGVKLNNANGENCGGTLELAFAVSCNSVFAPLGVKVGAPHLVALAERFGFNQAPSIPGAVESKIPPASQIQGELDVGSTAIGQGQVQASVLEMATVAATIADSGRRPRLSFIAGQPGSSVRVTSAAVAHTVRRLMIGVVRFGTGQAAAIAGVTVAGKTGTAELGNSSNSCSKSQEAEAQSNSENCLPASDPKNTDAWFASFAPALHPRIVVGVLLVRDGAGGTTAAPVARQVLADALQHG
jgi:penicillin-binding protein A